MIGVSSMDKRLFSLFENELLTEAKRIVPVVYNEKELIKFNTKEYKKFINKKYKLFSIDIELLLLGLCGMKFDGEDWENDEFIRAFKKTILEYAVCSANGQGSDFLFYSLARSRLQEGHAKGRCFSPLCQGVFGKSAP